MGICGKCCAMGSMCITYLRNMWALCLLYTVWCVAFRFKAVPCSWLPFENKTHQMFGKYRWKSKCLMLFTYAGVNMVLFLVVPSALLFSALFFLHSCNFVASSVSSTSFVLVSSVFPSLCGYMTAIPVFVHSFFSPRVFFFNFFASRDSPHYLCN